MARRTKEEAEQTRDEIIRAALDLFCEKGYSKTTFDEIATHINRTKGAVYWHFRNKPDLLIALIKEVIMYNQEYINLHIPEINNINDLKKYFLYNAELLQKHQMLRKFMFFALFQMEWSENLYKKVKLSLEDILDIPLKQMKKTLNLMKERQEIAPDIDTDKLSEIFFCFWRGAANDEIVGSPQANFVSFVSTGFDLIVGSIESGKVR